MSKSEHTQGPWKVNTPRTDKFYDMVSARECPDYSMIGHMPAKWSYEAILDFLDYAKRLEIESDELRASLEECLESGQLTALTPNVIIQARKTLIKARA